MSTFNKDEFKVTLKKSCLSIGAYKTAKKISENKEKLTVLVELLIETGINDAAYLIADFFMEKDDLKTFGNAFEQVDKNLNRKSLIKLDQEELLKEVPNAPKVVKKQPPTIKKETTKEAHQENKEGHKYIDLESTGIKDNIEFVNTDEKFESIKQHFLDKKYIAFDMLHIDEQISIITLASDSKIVVLDMLEIQSIKNVHKFLRGILSNDSSHIITYSFCRDAFFLGRNLFLDPEDMSNVHDIAELYLDKEGKRIQISQMYINCKNLAISQYCRKLNWLKRPLLPEMIDFTAVNAFCKLQIYQHLKENKMINDSTLVYEEPEGIRQKLLQNVDRIKRLKEVAASKSTFKVKARRNKNNRDPKNDNNRPKQRSKNEKANEKGYKPKQISKDADRDLKTNDKRSSRNRGNLKRGRGDRRGDKEIIYEKVEIINKD